MPDTDQLHQSYAEPLLRQGMVANHEALNARLRAALIAMSELVPDQGTNKKTGESYFSSKWLSARNLHQLPDPAFQALARMAESAANGHEWPHAGPGERRITAMWAIVSRNGLEGRPHKHTGVISGAYYVDAGACDDTGNGAFAIFSPEGNTLLTTIQPRSGMLLLFPNTLWHGVLRYESDQPRIVISFNLS
ncbi:MAG: putative 2OG-Fe(II) oxygenase [Sphingomonadales bacterium]